MEHLVVLTGAGVSAESGIATFRDSGGLWEGYDVAEVATPEAWERNPELVLDFYNMRREAAFVAKPNEAHKALVELEKYYNVHVITQNIDNLHEKAGSKNVLHLHGEIFKSRSTKNSNLIYDIDGTKLSLGDFCELGSQLRPHIVWFGEDVPKMLDAIEIVQRADILVIIGTSMVVYPAASLIHYTQPYIPVYVIDPGNPDINESRVHFINEKATTGTQKLLKLLINP